MTTGTSGSSTLSHNTTDSGGRSVVILTGLSGSGKTTALRALEDVGYRCMDNFPVVLLPDLLGLAAGATDATDDLAIVVDTRNRRYLDDAGGVIDQLTSAGVDVRVVYLDSNRDRIVRRYNETRRRHPLADTGDFDAAMIAEVALLEGLRERADLVIDTSELTVHQLKRVIQDQLGKRGGATMAVKLQSFGFKHGPPSADLVFDVRFVPNPYFVERLRPSTGLDPEVSSFVFAQDGVEEFTQKVEELLAFLVPRYVEEGKAYLTIGIGCTGGKHRSVAIAERLAVAMRADGIDPVVEHRDRAYWNPSSPR